MQVVILTGMSGAGKSTALKMMEDMGYFCMDNLPVALIEKFMELADREDGQFQNVAISIDIRNGQALGELQDVLQHLKQKNQAPKILFLDASDLVLVKRYKESRRNHPLAGNNRIAQGIEEERERIHFLRDQADYIIDTSQLLTRELKAELESIFQQGSDYTNLFITVLSFGFKYGIPVDSDLVFDVRFLPNPYYIEELRPKTGNDPEIQQFVMEKSQATEFLNKLEDMLRFLIPNYIDEGKNQLVISIGCTGGKHRSVTLANALYERLKKNANYGLRVEHKDISRDALRGK